MDTKTCLITGASGGLAGALAARLRKAGYRLALASRSDGIDHAGDDDCVITADVSTEDGAAAALDQAGQHFGAPPAAVVNAAGAILISPLPRTSQAQYRDCLAANLDTAFFVSKAYVTALQKEKRGGALVLVSSVAARIGVANHAAIAMAKAGVEALVRSLAADYSGAGLRVNAIAPGLMRTPATERLVGNEAARRQIAAQYPLGRHGEADDGAAAIEFLLSETAAWISGQVLPVDGGFCATRPYVKAG